MRVISWEQFIQGTGNREQGTGVIVREHTGLPSCSDSELKVSNHCSLFANLRFDDHCSLALTVGVFDGVHLGHQSLIKKICTQQTCLPAVVTFMENPLKTLNPGAFTGDILTLDQKLDLIERLGVRLAVLIDFSRDFSKLSGGEFIDLLLGAERRVKLLALGRDFRCGRNLDTGVEEIQRIAKAKGAETWIAPPVRDGGQPVSSSRIRQALAAGRIAEAERLLGYSLHSI